MQTKMTSEVRSEPADAAMHLADEVDDFLIEADQELLRIRRIGKRLFGVANCIITFGDASKNIREDERSLASIEAAFCLSIPLPSGPVYVSDLRINDSLCQHRLVTGAPYIRFFMAHPIFNQDRVAIGSIGLIDYLPRVYSDHDQTLLADLACLVERELDLRSISEAQIDLKRKNKNLRRKSLIDPLIGTWNRGAIMRILAVEATRCDKLGVPLSLIVADLDFFKKINDTYGHPAGDTVLVKVASRLRSCIRSQEALGRYGGEEFLIVLPGSSQATAMAVGERMRVAVAGEPVVIGDSPFNLTISLGVASTDLFTSATTDELISRADIALYAAKDAGRNCVVQAVPD
jgi:diguanylate cyclase (GGDEF)-like protein